MRVMLGWQSWWCWSCTTPRPPLCCKVRLHTSPFSTAESRSSWKRPARARACVSGEPELQPSAGDHATGCDPTVGAKTGAHVAMVASAPKLAHQQQWLKQRARSAVCHLCVRVRVCVLCARALLDTNGWCCSARDGTRQVFPHSQGNADALHGRCTRLPQRGTGLRFGAAVLQL